MAIKLTKNEQKVQKDRLKQYQRYLPTLQLKKQQLQSVIMKTKAELDEKEVERAQMIGDWGRGVWTGIVSRYTAAPFSIV